MAEDEMDGWCHQVIACEFEQAPEAGKGQGSLVCCSPRHHRESDTNEQLNIKKRKCLYLAAVSVGCMEDFSECTTNQGKKEPSKLGSH